jgi:predicted GNAT superfamily acetyltransferase
VGSHDVDEYSETYNDKTCYTIYIGRLGSYDKVYIDNFYGVDIRVDATLRGDKIDIYWQRVDGYEVEGVGTVYGDEIHFNYKVRDVYSGTRSDYCEAVAWRY